MICTVLYGVPGGFQIKRRVTTGDQEDKIVEAYEGYRRGSLTAIGRALLLGICDRTFRRYMNRYDKDGIKGLPKPSKILFVYLAACLWCIPVMTAAIRVK